MRAQKLVGTVIMVVTVIVAIAMVIVLRQNDPTPSPQQQAVTNTPPASIVVRRIEEQPCSRPWSNKPFNIPATGLAEHLCPGWADYPDGGINITFPDGTVHHDSPKEMNDNYFGQPPEGIYLFMTDSPGSKRSVTIYNRW